MMLHQEFRRAYIVFFGTDFLPTIMSNFRILLLLSHGCCFSWSFPFWSETNVPYDLWELIFAFTLSCINFWFIFVSLVWCGVYIYCLNRSLKKGKRWVEIQWVYRHSNGFGKEVIDAVVYNEM